MKVISKKLLTALLAIMTVVCLTAVIFVSASAADCTDGKHSMSYTVVNGELHHSCKKCGANDTTAEKNAEGGPVIYLGLYKADGTTRGAGNGFTPASAIRIEDELMNILNTYKIAKVAKPVTVVVVGQFIPELEFSIDAGARVTFTSVWNGVDYRQEAVAGTDCGNARIVLKANMHCYNEMAFENVTFEHVSNARYIGLNGNDLNVTGAQYYKDGSVVDTLEAGPAMCGILSGDSLNGAFEGYDLHNLNQTINVDSGLWICIDVGCYRNVSTNAFLDMTGKVTVNISGDAKIINRASGAPTKYRGLTACDQIISSTGLDVVYNITGGTFILNQGLNVVGRDSQAIPADSVRNVNATYNFYAGDFGNCLVYATVRDELSNSVPTTGKVTFNIAKGVNLGNIEIDTLKDSVKELTGDPVITTASTTTAPVTTEATTAATTAAATTAATTKATTAVTTAATTKATTAVTTAATTTASTTAATTAPAEGGVNVGLIIGIAVAVVVIVAVVVVVLKKKK